MSTLRITGDRPKFVGQLPNFTFTFTAPTSAPSATASAVSVEARKPDGSTIAATPAVGSGLSWTWTAAAVIDQPGTWWWIFTTTGTLVTAGQFSALIDQRP